MSSKKQLDALGDRLKHFERLRTEDKCIPDLPIYIRLDGRGFSNFTRKMNRPYDERMSKLMEATTAYLVKEFNATLGFSQSDEVSLVLSNTYQSPCIFEGKIQKLVSTIAASASVFFSTNFYSFFTTEPSEFSSRLPTFDCRVFELPNWGEATNAILWRYQDAKKNSVQMLAQSLYSHRDLQGLNTNKLLDKMLVEKNVDWSTYPEFFRTGVFVARQAYVKQTEDGACLRSKVEKLDVGDFQSLTFEQQTNIVTHSLRQVIGWTASGEVTLE